MRNAGMPTRIISAPALKGSWEYLFPLTGMERCKTLTFSSSDGIILVVPAGMAELADAPDLGSGGRPCRFKSCYPHDLKNPSKCKKSL